MEREREVHERIEREQERERQEKRRAAEQAVHKHFEESLRLAQHKHMTPGWSIINSLPPPPEEIHKKADHQNQIIVLERVSHEPQPHDRAYNIPPGVQQPGLGLKVDYPSVVRSQGSIGGKLPPETSLGNALPKAEPNFNLFGYPAYQPPGFLAHDGSKIKLEQSKSQFKNLASISVSKSVINSERDKEIRTNPPPLTSDFKSSVIVKNEGKGSYYHESSNVTHSHSSSSKHMSPQQPHFHKTVGYEYHPQIHSPHLGSSHPSHHINPHPSPHHMALDTQNLVSKANSRITGQQQQPQALSPHSRRQVPNQDSMEHRVKPPNLNTYPYSIPGAQYGLSLGVGPTKPKVSSPAPGHIYGKPMAGITTGTPVCRSEIVSSNPLPLTTKPSQPSYQPLVHPHPPPPAHRVNLMYDPRHNPPKPQGAATPTFRTHHPPACQTQPLDLGVSNYRDERSVSPKRKGVSTYVISNEIKRRRSDLPSSLISSPHALISSPHTLALRHPSTMLPLPQHQCGMPLLVQPLLSKVGEPSPLIASAATTITSVVNTAAYCVPALSGTTSIAADMSLAERPSGDERPSSAGSFSSVHLRQSPANVPSRPHDSPLHRVTCGSPIEETSTPPFTPVKTSSVDSDKSNSPGPLRTPTNYPVHKLKKAWLQRHSGEDVIDDTISNVSLGSRVLVPITHITTSATGMSFGSKDIISSPSDKSNPAQTVIEGNDGRKDVNFKGLPVVSSSLCRPNLGEFLNGRTIELPSSKPSIDDSSSTDTDGEPKTPPKRKPLKLKRKRGNCSSLRNAAAEERKRLAALAASESSDTDTDSGTDKDSDASSSRRTPNGKDIRKRGRRLKRPKFDPKARQKKSHGHLPAQKNPFLKPPISQLKKTGDSFLQDAACFEVAPKLPKCRECRWTPNQRSKNTPNIFCRFYAFRRLRYTKNGQLAIAGFSDPHNDAGEQDLRLWLPYPDTLPKDLDLEVSKLILTQLGDQFCDLLQQESVCPEIHMSDETVIAWKRVVQGVREMCDVCETTLFNFHWACNKCGFVVCIDCYKGRKSGSVKVWSDSDKEGKDEFLWLLCTNRQKHEQDKLMLTQIIAGNSLLKLGKRSHEVRALWGIPQYCECDVSNDIPYKGWKGKAKLLLKNLVKAESLSCLGKVKEENSVSNGNTKQEDKNSLTWLADVALSNEDKKIIDSPTSSSNTDSEDKERNYSTLRKLLIRTSQKIDSRSSSPGNASLALLANKCQQKSQLDTLDEVISSVVEHSKQNREEVPVDPKKPAPELKHFIRRYNWYQKDREPLPIRIMTHTESRILYPDLPHAWLCDGKLLRLTDPKHTSNGRIFADQWRRGQPVLVSDVNHNLNSSLWHPDSFARDFGDDKNDLVNCMTGNLVPNQPMRKFWEGFEHFSRRLKDEHGNPMLLKLKDWPPGEDFAEMLPSRFTDLMQGLPLPEYTNRTGHLNLASRLPDCFVRPDLGPKMYNAYGSALHPNKGTTNLHLDISDAVNVMVYVGIPQDTDSDEHIKEAFRAIDEAGCDILTRRRVRDKGELPGALWHIYHSRDADKIRDLLNKISLELGNRLEPHHDPIHDQSWYLDSHLRERLYKEYSVEGYAIVQCLGDAVFIPAGAPHQVRNLHNCIKVAEDFVSPENVSHCFHLTQEFRELSNDHTNHEDKLQIKNIIYHAIKDSLAVLSKYTGGEVKEKALAALLENGMSLTASEGSNAPITETPPAGDDDDDVPLKKEPSSNDM